MVTAPEVRPRYVGILTALAAAAAVFPLMVLADFLSYALLAGYQVNRLPRFGDPDPRVPLADLWRIRIVLGAFSFPYVSLGAMALARMVRLSGGREARFWILIGVALASAGVVVGFLMLDPGGLVDWFRDWVKMDRGKTRKGI
jgi:hypothetical protein